MSFNTTRQAPPGSAEPGLEAVPCKHISCAPCTLLPTPALPVSEHLSVEDQTSELYRSVLSYIRGQSRTAVYFHSHLPTLLHYTVVTFLHPNDHQPHPAIILGEGRSNPVGFLKFPSPKLHVSALAVSCPSACVLLTTPAPHLCSGSHALHLPRDFAPAVITPLS